MDFATIIGLIGGITIILLAILSGSDLGVFINIPSIMIVVGGTFTATLVKFPIKYMYRAFKVAMSAFYEHNCEPEEVIKQANELALLVRKGGVLALDGHPISSPFFQKGIQLAIDGREPEFVKQVLKAEIDQEIERHQTGERIFRAIGESAPALGMIGTLVGLVQMLVNMSDSSTIGPAMAVALLTTLYGALIANLIALPIADKISIKIEQEALTKSLIVESIHFIQKGLNPRIMNELLEAFLSHGKRSMKSIDEVSDKEI
ncbi:MAG: MotA/TolQ/ExbB proton channel family protein [Gammaproteobacteria bacterium]|nr:MotA/TolQ/ExbB proton channel family protein [Gammaproteobacteria bacterium]